jgi:hypothetical protein
MLSTKHLMAATVGLGLMAGALWGSDGEPRYGNKVGKPKKHRSKRKAKIAYASKRKNRN